MVIYFRQIDKDRVIKRLKEITTIENIYIENDVLAKIAELCDGDIRSSLTILEYICECKRTQNADPRCKYYTNTELINKLKLSIKKDTNTSIIEFVSKMLNQTRVAALKGNVNLREFTRSVFQT